MTTRILGLSAFFHDSAASLLEDGRIVAAAQEERFTRRKHDAGFPRNAIAYCLSQAGTTLGEVDHVVFYEKPFLKFERLLETYLAFAPRGFQSFRVAMPIWLKEKLFQRQHLTRELRRFFPEFRSRDLLFSEHHLSHAASAFYASPFHEAAVLTIDGTGEWATSAVAVGNGSGLKICKDISFPHSLGLLYSAFTYYTGFRVNSGEYKMMGLAPYGEPRYVTLIRDELIDLKDDGSFRLDLGYFDYCTGGRMTNHRFNELFGGPPRRPEHPIDRRHMDLAASVQVVVEEAILRMTRSVALETGQRNLCMAGGVVLNCVANGKVLRDGRFERMFVQPAAGDAGGALGAAFAVHHLHLDQPRLPVSASDAMNGAFLGPEFDQPDVERRLLALGGRFVILTDRELLSRTAQALADLQVVGWFQGRMEFGPRALGARSILADPRSPTMQEVLNRKVKRRESFRPFAPSVLAEHRDEWFDLNVDSPYMAFVANVADAYLLPVNDVSDDWQDRVRKPRSWVPAVTHVDGSARVQTVDVTTNPRFHALLSSFHELTGCPMLVNTSFNVAGEPIVCTPEDAFRCFMATDIEALVIGNCYLEKQLQETGRADPQLPVFALD